MNSTSIILLFLVISNLVISQKKPDAEMLFENSNIVTMVIREKLDENQARTIDLLLSARIKNVFFSVTDAETGICSIIVSEKLTAKYVNLDSINVSFNSLTGFNVDSFSTRNYDEDVFYQLYNSVEYFYENHKPEDGNAPRCYRTGNADKDQLNYNLVYQIWKKRQNENN